ncbi:polysaccharide biosynthesis protein [Spirochaetia bacterium]|nr:polysaccharide biosynthesis protein [Spirochaetia bacterium]
MLLEHDFFKNVSKVAGATLLVQVIGIITMPIISRLYTPQAVGQFSLFNSIVGILSVFGTGMYDSALILPKEKKDGFSLVFVSHGFAFIVMAVLFLLIVYFGKNFESIANYKTISKYFLLIPLFVFFTSSKNIMIIWNNRNKQFGFNAKINILNAVATKSTNILFGFIGFATGIMLIIVNFLVLVVESIFRIIIFTSQERGDSFRNLSIVTIKKNIVRYKKFPLIATWGGLLDTGSVLIVPILLSIYFTDSDVGLYGQSLTLVQLPIALIGSSIGQVLSQKLSVAKNTGELSDIITSIFPLLLKIGIPIFAIIFFWGEEIFSFFLGDRWAVSGIYAGMLAPWCCLKLCLSPMSAVFSVLERQGLLLFLTMFILISRVISIAIGGYYNNIYLSVLLFSITGVVCNVIGIILIFSISKSKPMDILKSFVKNPFHKI